MQILLGSAKDKFEIVYSKVINSRFFYNHLRIMFLSIATDAFYYQMRQDQFKASSFPFKHLFSFL